jgi:hypothetical protein
MDELTRHNKGCLGVVQHIAEIEGIESFSGYIKNLSSGPLIKYGFLHINTRANPDNIEYAPILIDKNFTYLYTNTGILQISDRTYLVKNKLDLINKYNLKNYNNKYYYIDQSWSHSGLEKYYTKKEIQENWKSLIAGGD